MECKKKGSPKITLKAFCLTIKRIPKVKIFYPELCVLQLSRRDSCPAVKLEAGDEVCAGVEQEADALHREVLALGALEVSQLAQAGGELIKGIRGQVRRLAVLYFSVIWVVIWMISTQST